LTPLAELFPDLILTGQDCFASQEGWEELLQLIPDKLSVGLKTKWAKHLGRSSEDKWSDLKAQAKSFPKDSLERVRVFTCSFEAGV
jgi:DNA primase small subunit